MDVVTFGESMVVFNPKYAGSLDSVGEFARSVAGAESNVAIGLSRLGHKVAWMSRLGQDSFGRLIYKTLRGEGVDVSRVTWDSTRPTGVYFKERMGEMGTNVYYYRANSAASQMGPDTLILDDYRDAKYLFVTGITPALSESCLKLIMTAIKTAREYGMQVVFDPNIRFKLWDEMTAREVLTQVAALSDIILPGFEEARFISGMTDEQSMARWFLQGNTKLVVIKLGPAGAYFATQKDQGYVDGFKVNLVDEIGAGDAFAAGLLSGLLEHLPIRDVLRRATALGALAVTGIGDFEALPYRHNLEEFLNSVKPITR